MFVSRRGGMMWYLGMGDVGFRFIAQSFKLMQKQVYEVFILPLTFKTVSFHHRAHYSIRVYLQRGEEVIGAQVLHQFETPPKIEIDDRSGNITGIGGVIQDGQFWSQRFPIDYNDQSAKFATGVWLRLKSEQKRLLAVGIELYRTDLEVKKDNMVMKLEEPVRVKVSQQLLYLSLQQNKEALQTFNYRKLIFPTNEYISFIDLCALVCKIGWETDPKSLEKRRERYLASDDGLDCCCMVAKKPTDPERLLQEIYSFAVEQKLDNYVYVSTVLKQKIKQYLWLRKHRGETLNTGEQFEKLFVRRKISDLSYVRVKSQLLDDQRLDSNLPIVKGRTLTELLCEHYQSGLDELGMYIVEESMLIEHNIRALFQRVIQISMAMGEGLVREVSLHEKKRVKEFMFAGQFPFPAKLQNGIAGQTLLTHKKRVSNLLNRLQNFTVLEQKQPLLLVSQQYQQMQTQGKPIDISRTVTILVHGFRGNQYDLSKMKSYLNLFLGFSHFYAIKSIAGSQISNARISKSAQLAGEELSRYLDMHSGIKTVNVIGFSMGGVIARAMMKHVGSHRQKFNLLLTLASPHLGIKQLQSCLVRTGLLYMRRVAKIESIQDLNVERNNDNSRFLMDLASCEYINYFKSVVLVGSKEDEYVPMYSSLCDYKGENEHIRELNTRFNEQRRDIVRCLARVQCDQTLWDRLTMRKAHINLLEDDSFIRLLVVKLQSFFTRTK